MKKSAILFSIGAGCLCLLAFHPPKSNDSLDPLRCNMMDQDYNMVLEIEKKTPVLYYVERILPLVGSPKFLLKILDFISLS